MKKILFIVLINMFLLGGQLWTVANFGDGGQKWTASQKVVRELEVENEKIRKQILSESTIDALSKKSEKMGLLKMDIEYAKVPSVAQRLE